MLVVIVSLSLFLTANAQYPIYSSDLYDVLFGNFSTLSSMWPSETSEEDSPEEPSEPSDSTIPNITEPFHYNISNHEHHYDMLDFHDITEKAKNLTRRHSYWTHQDPVDNHTIMDRMTWNTSEDEKKGYLSRANIQWLQLTRYFVTRALRQRESIRDDKRFRLGYLFNRLRRLSYEQLKLCTTAEQHSKFEHRNLEATLNMYEQVVRLDVDIDDTVDLIKTIYNTPADCDRIQDPKKKIVVEEEDEDKDKG